MSSMIGASNAAALGVQKPALRQQMGALFQDVKSGNVSGAKSDLSALSELLGGGQGGAGAPSNSFSAMLGQVGTALSTGDIAGAQSALANEQPSRFAQISAEGQAADAAAGQHQRHHGGGGSGGLSSLISSIQGGDIDGAQQAYSAMSGDDSSGTDSTSGASGTGDVFSQLMASVGQSLANSDIVAAQQDLTNFAQSHKTGSAVNVTA